MAIDRRQFLIGSGAAIAAPAPGAASVPGDNIYLSSARTGTGRHAAVLFDIEGQVQWQVELPDRGHGGAFRKGSSDAVIFARRPGTFGFVIDRSSGQASHVMAAPQNRHFYGHGTYSPDGRLLFTTENDFAQGRGVIGIWDAAAGYECGGV